MNLVSHKRLRKKKGKKKAGNILQLAFSFSDLVVFFSSILQEIDGKALLSLSPEMLMKGMSLKLGPAVKLYNHIVNLRTALSI